MHMHSKRKIENCPEFMIYLGGLGGGGGEGNLTDGGLGGDGTRITAEGGLGAVA